MARSDKDRILGGMIWKFAERISSQGVSFVISIILARLLSPAEYGVIAMMNVFIVFANVFMVAGLTTSLVQKKDADELDFTTVFHCTFFMSIILYGILFVSAPFIAEYYHMPEMTLLVRVFSLSLPIQSYQTIQQAYISRNMLFKKTFKSSLISSVLSGVIGILMAYSGFGVWSLVAQHILGCIIGTFVLRHYVSWRPTLMFSLQRAKPLFNYGIKILGSTLVSTIYKEIRQLLIGLYYTPTDLALFNRGAHLPHIVTTNLDSTIRSVLFPAMSNHSDNQERVKQMLRRAIMNSSYITYFFLTLMAVASKPIVHILLTDKWLACVPYMQILCFTYMIMTVSTSNIQALKAIGKSSEVLKLELFKKPVFLLIVLASLPFGVKAIVLTSPINALYALWMNIGPTKKHLNYGRREQILDLMPGFLLATAMAAVTWPLTLLPWNAFLIMGLQIVVAFVSYVSLSEIFKVEAYLYCKRMLLEVYHRKIRKR